MESSFPSSHLLNFQRPADVVFQGSKNVVTKNVGNSKFDNHDVLNNHMDVTEVNENILFNLDFIAVQQFTSLVFTMHAFQRFDAFVLLWCFCTKFTENCQMLMDQKNCILETTFLPMS